MSETYSTPPDGSIRGLPLVHGGTGPGLRRGAMAVAAGAAVVAAALAPTPPEQACEIELLSTANALIMAGTDMHVMDQSWIQMAINNYIEPTMGGTYTGIAVETPAQFWPFTGPDDMLFDLSVQGGTQAIGAAIAANGASAPDADPMVIFGYSQSSVIATATKRRLAETITMDTAPPEVSFVMLANPNRPSGGINSRFTGAFIEEIGWTFSAAAPTDTPFSTVDVAKQYDFFADFPRYPLNVLATANVIVALLYGAHDYTDVTLSPVDPAYDPNTVIQQLGDTTYYFIPTAKLPLLRPLRDLGFDPVMLDAAEPAMRLLVEFGYDRNVPFGQPAPALLTQREDLDQLGADLAAAIEQGRAIVEASAADLIPPAAEPGRTTTPLLQAAPAPTVIPAASGTASQSSQRKYSPAAAPRRTKPVSAAPTPDSASESERIGTEAQKTARRERSPASR